MLRSASGIERISRYLNPFHMLQTFVVKSILFDFNYNYNYLFLGGVRGGRGMDICFCFGYSFVSSVFHIFLFSAHIELFLLTILNLSHSEPNIATTFWRRSQRKVIAEQWTASSRCSLIPHLLVMRILYLRIYLLVDLIFEALGCLSS